MRKILILVGFCNSTSYWHDEPTPTTMKRIEKIGLLTKEIYINGASCCTCICQNIVNQSSSSLQNKGAICSIQSFSFNSVAVNFKGISCINQVVSFSKNRIRSGSFGCQSLMQCLKEILSPSTEQKRKEVLLSQTTISPFGFKAKSGKKGLRSIWLCLYLLLNTYKKIRSLLPISFELRRVEPLNISN